MLIIIFKNNSEGKYISHRPIIDNQLSPDSTNSKLVTILDMWPICTNDPLRQSSTVCKLN